MSATFQKYTHSGSLPSLKNCTQIKQLDEGTMYYFRMVTERGEVILDSEAHYTMEARDKAIAAVKFYCTTEENYERVQTPDGSWFFNLRSGHGGGIVAISRNYSSIAEMEAGITVARFLAPKALILEESATNKKRLEEQSSISGANSNQEQQIINNK